MELRIRMGPPGEVCKSEVRLGFPRQNDGRRVQIIRQIDKRADRYSERVWDPATGEVLHEQDHRLSEHRGHGSDKPRPS
jgi:hypothetical protein